MKIIQQIPKGQKKLIAKSLANQLKTVNQMIDEINELGAIVPEDLYTQQFDLVMLNKLIGYELNVVLTKEEMDKFTVKNNVDFPIFIE